MNIPQALHQSLNTFNDPILKLPYTSLGWASMQANTLHVRLGYPSTTDEMGELTQSLETHLNACGHDTPVEFSWRVVRHVVDSGQKPKFGVNNVIAIGSGKGGVGKSTVSANMAVALAQRGARVGLLDADIYGPSQAALFGVEGKPEVVDKKMVPFLAHGVHVLSMANLVEPDSAMIWRGPMVSGALLQFFNEALWPNLDYLLIDLPPGTGDVQLTMAQKLPVTGAVVVTTPQDLSLLDAQKAVTMFDKVKIPVLGVVQNMTETVCSACGHRESLFGELDEKSAQTRFKAPIIGALPLNSQLCQLGPTGGCIQVTSPQSPFVKAMDTMAATMAAKLSELARDNQVVTQKVMIS